MTKLSAENITKKLDSGNGIITAVEVVTFTANEDEFVVIVGPSGCIKATLLNIINGLVSAQLTVL